MNYRSDGNGIYEPEDNPGRKYLSGVILNYMRANHMTQEDMALELGVAQNSVGQWIACKRSPYKAQWKKLIAVLGKPAYDAMMRM